MNGIRIITLCYVFFSSACSSNKDLGVALEGKNQDTTTKLTLFDNHRFELVISSSNIDSAYSGTYLLEGKSALHLVYEGSEACLGEEASFQENGDRRELVFIPGGCLEILTVGKH